MRQSGLAGRYAKALFEIATSLKKQDEFLMGLQAIQKAFNENAEVISFIQSPLVVAAEKEKVIGLALKDKNLPEELVHFILLLAHKSRLPLVAEIVAAYQASEDELNKVHRGVVKSTQKLSDQSKADIQKSIESAIQKKVILQFEEDPELIGGIFAQVGSLTFNDSLSAHLHRIKEDLTRRTH